MRRTGSPVPENVLFGEKLANAIADYGQLCVGIDPHPWLLDEWGLNQDSLGLESFGLKVVAACSNRIGIIKPQVALFEHLGSEGYRALEKVIRAAKEAGLLVIADAKRGDIGSTMNSYLEAWLGEGSSLECDAMTVNPFMGAEVLESLSPFAGSGSKGVFVLTRTSNSGSELFQNARTGAKDDSPTVALEIYRRLAECNAPLTGRFGSFGAVIGATSQLAGSGIDFESTHDSPLIPILAPGFGHQGAEYSAIKANFGAAAGQVIASVSRSVLAAGPGRLDASIDSERKRLAEAMS